MASQTHAQTGSDGEMRPDSRLEFKIASEESEFEQIFRLDYDTFVEEIPQHPPNPERRHIDRFHSQNTYLIAKDGDRVVGKMALRSDRPFSLDEKLGAVESFLPPGHRVCEIRLLAVRPEYRKTAVFYKLARFMALHGLSQGFNLAIISGTPRQQKLYEHLGFVPFGSMVGTAEAPFQPMYLTLADFERRAAAVLQVGTARSQSGEPLSFLSGPVRMHPEVMAAYSRPPVSHRSRIFRESVSALQSRLCSLAGVSHCGILLGSGTLANDVVGGQLSLRGEPGLVVTNGEFGARLADHARRFGLRHAVLERPWGDPIEESRLRSEISRHPEARWLWAAACETSTGVLNNAEMLQTVCAETGLRLCLDAISALGTLPMKLGDAFLASAVSGKGLGSMPGLALVLYNHEVPASPDRLPRYLDLGYCAEEGGIPFTQSSSLVAALHASLDHLDVGTRWERNRGFAAGLRATLRNAGFAVVARDEHSSPVIVTVALQKHLPSANVGRRLERAGFVVGYESRYLAERNWLQFCLMGEYTKPEIDALAAAFLDAAGRAARQAGAP
jgi:aspartate aminotransferase-like enzyme